MVSATIKNASVLRVLAVFLCAGLLSACASGRSVAPVSGGFKIGQPYQIAGTWYYPHEDPDYNETGIASWYGSQFHGRQTANGERFDMNLLSAAHPTLPMPSNVRVTNLNNGKSIIVRVNDRGPFAHGRIIDLSRQAARALDFEQDGTAPVRVQNLGIAHVNVASRDARDVLEGREMRLAAAESVPVTAVTLTPPSTAASQPVAAGPAQTLSAPQTSQRNRLPDVTDRLYVQVGAFGEETNALNLLSRLNVGSDMSNARVATTMINGRHLYRVRVGPYSDVNQADVALRRVQAMGIDGARIVVD